MNKLVIYLIALISGVIGVFAFSPFDYWGLAYVSFGGLLLVAKNAKKSTALLATFLWSMGFFCFGHHVTDVLVVQVLAKGRVHTYPLQYLGTVAELDELSPL